MEGHQELKTYLGFDLSTQQLKAVALNDSLQVISESCVHFDLDLPEFRTHGGVNHHSDEHTVTAPTIMWVKAFDLVLERLKIDGIDYSTVMAVSGSGQQHGSVYWKKGAIDTLTKLKSDQFLHQQLAQCFSVRDSPVWMDSSTTNQCKQLEEFVGGPQTLANITGSRAYERFTGSQIAKISSSRPETYAQTERICLVSNFCASLFIGNYAPIDYSDGSGMNLLDIRAHQWSQQCLDFCGPELKTKLGETLVPSASVVGPISRYFVERYGFSQECKVVSFTGDNPASLIGMGLRKDDVAVSLGTSDTIFLRLSNPKPALDGHILCNPLDQESYMALICFKNGSRTRERIRDECSEGDWALFNELLESTPRGNFGNVGFYFDYREIYPLIAGDFRFNKYDTEVKSFSKEVEVRALIEGQFLRLRVHAENLGYTIGPNTRILATGGASANTAIVQALADVFNAPVILQTRPNSACLGGAFLAKYAIIKDKQSFEQMIEAVDSLAIAANPSSDAFNVYTPLVQRYRKLENEIAKRVNTSGD